MFYLSSIFPPPGEQPCSENCHIHWAGNFVDIPTPYYYLLSFIGVSNDRTVNLN